jgi:nitric oxide dioxygenase
MALQVALLETSFAKARPVAEAFTAQFYDTLFTDSPEVKPLFAHTHMVEQGAKLFASLETVIANLQQPEILADAVKGLGTRHVQYGVLPAHYPAVGGALLKTLALFLQDAWTPELKQAWVDAYGAVVALMLEGADYPPDEIALKA